MHDTVEGTLPLTPAWSLSLPRPFGRRLDGGDLVLWRSGFRICASVWAPDLEQTSDHLDRIHREMPGDAFGHELETDGPLTRFAYRMLELRGSQQLHALHGFALCPARGEVHLAMYVEDPNDLPEARAIWKSLETRVAVPV